ncbi:branched-chain amino acid ABC transporter ATP-binding protein/permease [Salinisphaera aquimarina]|uniref:ATP-binding cassette domain-containing protein n=1 Tax=Salinisphaera aquimarina TaxID=2094031 RepID=A0ABV7ERN2_9GAMM
MSRALDFLKHPLFVLAIALLALPLLMPWLGSTISLATQVSIYALYAIAFNVLLGYTGLVSFGASLFFGFASYVAGLFAIHVYDSAALALLAATAATALLSVVIGLLILRRRGIYFALLTLAFTQLGYEIAFHWTGVTGGENGLQGVSRGGLYDPLLYYAFTALLVWLSACVLLRIVHSPFGRVLQAIRDDELRARCMGYNPHRYKLGAFVLSSSFIGLAGGLLTFLIRGAYAENMNWQHAGDPVLMTVLGGMHHFLGPLWGAIIYINLQDQLSAVTEHWWLIFGALLMAVVLLSPEGLSGMFTRLFGHDRWGLTRSRVPARPITPIERSSKPAHANDDVVLSVSGLNKSFGRVVTAKDIDLDIRRGSIHSLLGPNGAGKTTFFNILSGLLAPDSGRVHFNGRDITRLSANQRTLAGLARSFQVVSVPEHATVFEAVRVAAQAHHEGRHSLWSDAYALPGIAEQTWQALQAVGLDTRAEQITTNLPHGEQRLLDIAVTLAGNPDTLLLDEPLAGLADAERERISQLIKRLAQKHTVVLIEHDIDRVIALSDYISVLHLGQVIASGTPDQVIDHPDVVAAYLGDRESSAADPAAGPGATDDAGKRTYRPLLELQGIASGYGGSRILDDLDLTVGEGESVALLGRNGVGKTTTLATIMGTVPRMDGRIGFDDRDISTLSTHQVNRLGVSLVPQGRRIFPNLTVTDNLQVAARPGGWSRNAAFELFPKLKQLEHARGGNLSGGEQQMLAIARALMAPTRLILLDEPFEGLAPAIVGEVMHAIAQLRGEVGILLVEQRVELALQMTDRAYIMVNGHIAYEGSARDLRQDEATLVKLLGV